MMSPRLRRIGLSAIFLAAVVLASCGGGGGGSSSLPGVPSNNPSPSSKPTATPSSPSPMPSATAAGVDWSTFGFDLQRTGYNPSEKTIGPGSFGSLHPLWAKPAQIGTHMQGEPIVAMGVNVAGAKRNLLYAGGGHGVLYAIDADTGATVWSRQFPTTSFSCTPGKTTFWGIEGAAALDRPRNRLYVPDGGNQIHAVDLSTGEEEPGWPVTIAPLNNLDFIHDGLNYNPNNGYLYVGTSSVCDVPPWHGRLTAINTATGAIVNTFYTVPSGEGGGIWGYGGAAIDPATNNVFIATGNSVGTPQDADYAEHIVELSADLGTVIAQNHPTGMPPMPNADFGTTPLLFQPVGCPPLLAVVNKSGAFLLYDRANIAGGPAQMIDMSIAHEASFRQVPAYDPVTNYVYVAMPSTYGIYQPGVAAFSMNSDCTLNPTPVWNAVFGPDGAMTTAEATRSAVTIADGVVYVSGYSDDTTYAFNAATGSRLWSAPLGGQGIVGPVVVNGRLYVGEYTGAIYAWVP